MAIQIEKPDIKHKYITLFDTEEEFNAAYPDFEEVNWSDVAYPQERPDNYRTSRRLSNMYAKDTPPDYKFDNVDDFVPEDAVREEDKTYADAHKIATYNDEDDIRKTFFLEIVWGYSGWEWHDYERVIGTDPDTEGLITETLKGGNLYKIKEIQTVPHIIDGHRLQHINDLLNSQNQVTKVAGFNTENLIAANRAFKRFSLVRTWDNVLECHFVNGYDEQGNFNYPFGYADPVTGEGLLENLVEADGLFFNNKIYMYEGDFINTIPVVIPNITSIDRLYSYGAYTPNLRFKMENLESLTNAFKMAMFNTSTVDVNTIFIGNTLKHIKDFNGMFAGASIIVGNDTAATVNLDLTSSEVPSSDVIDLSHFVENVGPDDYNDASGHLILNKALNVDLSFTNKVNLSYAFSGICRNKMIAYDEEYNKVWNNYLNNKGFSSIVLDFNSHADKIVNLDYALSLNILSNLPLNQWVNANCSENYIYQGSTFNIPVEYDFSPTNVVNESIGQFNGCTFNVQHNNGYFANFNNCDAVRNFTFEDVKFGDNVNKILPYTIHNSTIYDNTTKYRDISFKGSQISKLINNSVLYLDYCTDAKYWKNSGLAENNLNPFFECANVDFADDRLDLYYKDRILSQAPAGSDGYTRFNFQGNTSMTETPYIHCLLDTTGKYNNYYISFDNLTNLKKVHFEDFEVPYGNNNGNFNCENCNSLEELNIATNTNGGWKVRYFNLKICTSLKAPNLVASLRKLTILAEIQQIPRTVWDACLAYDSGIQAFCLSIGGTIYIDENN